MFFLGKYKTKESLVKYEELIAEYLANGKKLPPTRSRDRITVQELVCSLSRMGRAILARF